MSMKQLLFILFFLVAMIDIYAQSDSIKMRINSVVFEDSSEYEIIDPVETIPEFPGGQDSMRIFIQRNNNWSVGQETIVGRVFIAIVAEKDGIISNIEIIRGLHETCDNEAKRIISLMPRWKPGEQMGIPVRTKMIVPITFNGMK